RKVSYARCSTANRSRCPRLSERAKLPKLDADTFDGGICDRERRLGNRLCRDAGRGNTRRPRPRRGVGDRTGVQGDLPGLVRRTITEGQQGPGGRASGRADGGGRALEGPGLIQPPSEIPCYTQRNCKESNNARLKGTLSAR